MSTAQASWQFDEPEQVRELQTKRRQVGKVLKPLNKKGSALERTLDMHKGLPAEQVNWIE